MGDSHDGRLRNISSDVYIYIQYRCIWFLGLVLGCLQCALRRGESNYNALTFLEGRQRFFIFL